MTDAQIFLEGLLKLGFELVREESFEHRTTSQRYYILARRDGVLLDFDTIYEGMVNRYTLLCNWRSNGPVPFTTRDIFSCSGGKDGIVTGSTIWSGGRVYPEKTLETMTHDLDVLTREGKFLNPWTRKPSMILAPYTEKHQRENYEKRIQLLPEWVQEMVGKD